MQLGSPLTPFVLLVPAISRCGATIVDVISCASYLTLARCCLSWRSSLARHPLVCLSRLPRDLHRPPHAVALMPPMLPVLFACIISLALLASCTVSVSNRLVYLTSIGLSHAMARPLPIHCAELFSWPTHRRCSSVMGFLPSGHSLYTRGISWPYADHI